MSRLAREASRGDGKDDAFPGPSQPGKAAGSVIDHPGGMSFDNAFVTPTYYVIAVEHELLARRSQRGAAPRLGRTRRRRRSS
jgi:hypothetical protein